MDSPQKHRASFSAASSAQQNASRPGRGVPRLAQPGKALESLRRALRIGRLRARGYAQRGDERDTKR
jgi:hypothetical protein